MFIDHYQMPVGFLETILMEKLEEMLGFWFEIFFFSFVGLFGCFFLWIYSFVLMLYSCLVF